MCDSIQCQHAGFTSIHCKRQELKEGTWQIHLHHPNKTAGFRNKI